MTFPAAPTDDAAAQPARRPVLAILVAGLLAVAAGAAVQATGVLGGLERDTLSARFALRHNAPPKGVAIVAIDDDSFARLHEQWPFRRSLHARVIDRLHAAGARAIVYDVQFSEPTKPAEDMALFRAIRRSGRVVLATTQIEHGRTDILGGDANVARAHARVAASGLPVDASGSITHFPYEVSGLASVATTVAEEVRGRPLSHRGFEDDAAWIDFRGGAGAFPTLPIADVIAGRFDPSDVRGKVVVVGATTPSLHDVHETPTARTEPMPGPEVQANAIWTVLHGTPLRSAPGWLALALIVLLGMSPAIARLRLRVLPAALIAPVLVAAYLMAGQVAFFSGTILPIVAPLTSVLLGVLAMVVVSHLGETRARVRSARDAARLSHLVRDQTEQLKETQLEVITRLGQAAELRDEQTGRHIERIGVLAHRLGLAMGLGVEEAELLHHASAMHDIGKIGIPDHILLKPGRLTPDEFEVMKTHTTVGASILSGSSSPLLQTAEQIALTHHERWDGNGYPAGLRGEEIPLYGRIVAICDVFDALISERPYKRAWTVDEAIRELRAQSGRHFDPALVEPFIALGPTAHDDAPRARRGAPAEEPVPARATSASQPVTIGWPA